MKGWLYVISNKAITGMVKVGTTPMDPVAYAKALDKAGLPFPHEVGYEALVPGIDEAEKAVAAALSRKSEGKGWYSCAVAEAVREITGAVGRHIVMENRYDVQSRTDKLYDEVSSPDPARRTSVLSDPSCPLNVLRFAVEREKDVSVLLAMLENPACVGLGDGLADLVDRISGKGEVLLAIASNHCMRPAVLEAVFGACQDAESSDHIILALVRNPRFPTERLFEVAEDYSSEDNEILPAVVARLDCMPETLAFIVYNSGNPGLRKMAKRHPQWTPEAFRSFLEDKAGDCPSCVACHPDCPPDILAHLLNSGDMETKRMVLSNRACPLAILVEASVAGDAETCSDSSVAELAEVAMANPCNPLVLAGKAASADEFSVLAHSKFPRVVLRVAANPACHPEVLSLLSRNDDPVVRAAVACNRSSHRDIVASLACDRAGNVRNAVARRPDCPVELLTELANDGDPNVRSSALRNRSCPRDVLERYAKHDLFEWRLIVLENPACPDSVVEALAKDTNHLVRATAKQIKFASGKATTPKLAPKESVEVVRNRFRSYVRRTLGAIIEESELLRLAALPDDVKEKFTKDYPSQATQLALFEKYLLPKLRERQKPGEDSAMARSAVR